MTRLTARADRRLVRPNHRSHRYVLVEVTAPGATTARERTPVNLAFVLLSEATLPSAEAIASAFPSFAA